MTVVKNCQYSGYRALQNFTPVDRLFTTSEREKCFYDHTQSEVFRSTGNAHRRGYEIT
jgi:hypothetical protein